MVQSRFTLAVCEIHNTKLHGFTQGSSRDIKGHYLVTYNIDVNEFMNDIEECQDILNAMEDWYDENENKTLYHDYIRNYSNIVRNPKYFQIHIVEMKELEGNEYVASLKTYLINIIQRRWRKYYANKQKIINERKRPFALLTRELTGKYPKGLNNLPNIRKHKFKQE